MIKILYLGAMLLLSQFAAANMHTQAADNMQVARYSTVDPRPSDSQKSLLNTLIHTRFHQKITTVGEALDFLLMRSGYRLQETSTDKPEIAILYSYPLPEVQRELGPIRLRDALRVLAGQAYQVNIDPLNRLISFEIKPRYQSWLTQSPIYQAAVAKQVEAIRREEIKQAMLAHKAVEIDKQHATSTHPHKQTILPKQYGPIDNNETLFSIAKQYAVSYDVSVTKMAYGLYLYNQEQFEYQHGLPSMSHLKEGAIFNLPSRQEVAVIDEGEAWEAIRRSQ